MRIIACLIFIGGIVSLVLGIVTRIVITDKILFGLAALTYMRFAGTLFLLSINLILLDYLFKKKE